MSDSGPTTLSDASAGFADSFDDTPEAAPVESTVPDPAVAGATQAIEQAAAPQGLTPGELKALRAEAANYRTQLREEQNVWSGLHPDDAKFIRETIAMAGTDPQGAAARWAQITAAFAAPQQAPEAPPPLSRSDLEQFFAEREQAAAEKQAVSEVVAEAQALGYQPQTAAYNQFLNYALNEHDGDLQAAHQAIQGAAAALKQQAVDEYLAGKKTSAGRTPTTTAQGGGAPSGAPPAPQTLAEASELLRNL
jgi:hypothetical protein